MAKWATMLGLLPCLLLLPRSAAAADDCSPLFVSASPHLTTERCSLSEAGRHLAEHLPLRCAEAARAGRADESMARLYAIALRHDPAAVCSLERQQLAMYALCTLRPPNHRTWLRMGILGQQPGSRFQQPSEVIDRCLLALLEQGDEQALADTLHGCTPESFASDCRFDVLQHLFEYTPVDQLDLLAPALKEASRQRIHRRDRLRRWLCQRARDDTARLRAACAEIPPDEEQRERAAEEQTYERSEQRRILGLRIGLTVMSAALAGLQVGLAIPYRDRDGGQILATAGGAVAGCLLATDVMVGADRNLLLLKWFGVPLALLLGAVGGGVAYATSRDSTGVAVSSSITAAFSLASGVALSWVL